MTIELARIEQAEEIFSIFSACRKALEQENIFQWTEHYPTIDVISRDIRQGHLYSLNMDNSCRGVICLNTMQDPEYQAVDWADSSGNAMVIHRLAIHPEFQKQGLAGKLMDFAEDKARGSYSSIRLDAYSPNTRSLRFYEKRGYDKRGEIFFPGRALPFFCYEMKL